MQQKQLDLLYFYNQLARTICEKQNTFAYQKFEITSNNYVKNLILQENNLKQWPSSTAG